MVFCRISSRLLDQVLIEINRCNVPPHNKATNQRQLKVETFSSSCLVRQVSEHLLAAFAAIIFVLLAENTNFYVVDLHERDDSTGSIEGERAYLRAPVMRDTCLEHNSTHEVLTDHENRFSDLMISRLRIRRTLEERTADPTSAWEKKQR